MIPGGYPTKEAVTGRGSAERVPGPVSIGVEKRKGTTSHHANPHRDLRDIELAQTRSLVWRDRTG